MGGLGVVQASWERSYTPALVCLLAQDMGNASQGRPTVDGSPEIGT
jgi:hypothetical protein